MMKPIVLIGGGGHCKSVIEAAISSRREIVGVLDVAENVGKKILDFEIIGTDEDIDKYDGCEFVITVGSIKNTLLRNRIAQQLEGKPLATVIASTANVSRWAQVGEGSVVLHGAMVNADAVIGKHCIINTLANIEHDAVVGDFCHISTGAMVNGGCKVGANTFLGSQSVMLNGAEICEDCVVAAGSFVRKSIKKPGIYAGNPAILYK